MAVVTIAGSPDPHSRSTALLGLAARRLRDQGLRIHDVAVRELPASGLLRADTKNPAIAQALNAVEQAGIVIVATPVYKAAYSGLLKAFLDLLPQYGLKDKAVLPIATGGSSAHLLALDYALRPVLASLGARVIVESLFVSDGQLSFADGDITLAPEIEPRLDTALIHLQQAHNWLSGDTPAATTPAPTLAPISASNIYFPAFAV
jgi:FMN reductase